MVGGAQATPLVERKAREEREGMGIVGCVKVYQS